MYSVNCLFHSIRILLLHLLILVFSMNKYCLPLQNWTFQVYIPFDLMNFQLVDLKQKYTTLFKIAVHFEYCTCLHSCRKYQGCKWNRTVITYLVYNLPTNYYSKSFKKKIETMIIFFLNERICKHISKPIKGQEQDWDGALLWQKS